MDAKATIQTAANSDELEAITCRPDMDLEIFSDMALILH
jgi:hypothetical protein